MLYRPERVLVAGFIVYFIVFLLAPLEPRVKIYSSAILFIGICCLAFAIGSWFAGRFTVRKSKRFVTKRHLMKHSLSLFRLTFMIGFIGNGMRLVDTYIIRGVGSLTGGAAREILVDNASGLASIISGLLYPFGYLPIFIYFGSKHFPRNNIRLLLAIGLFLIPAVSNLVLFSRSFLLVSVAMMYFGAAITLYGGKVMPRQLRLPVIGAVVGVTVVSIIVFSWRLNEMELSIATSILDSAYGYTITPNGWAQEILARGEQPFSNILQSILPLTQYYTHSMFEFQILWSDSSQQVFSYGSLHFSPYVKLLEKVGIVSSPDLAQLFPRVGVFTSFFGPLWVDAGWFSPFFMLVFGYMTSRTALRAKSGDIGAYPLYTYFVVVLFFAPVVNFLISAQGMYIVNAFVIFWFLTRKYANSIVKQGP